ncbi:hypothetical protein NDU88_001413 [Pleurodeles waltl]|uniref:Uncharacterized protein n=1 Tax=Pleurodeles waltl TaxID=8319 RepID=A0AAV7U6Y9_PLEWA|nr:hypothetical protein NDU88_001413 [Pleurodeles waltl]
MPARSISPASVAREAQLHNFALRRPGPPHSSLLVNLGVTLLQSPPELNLGKDITGSSDLVMDELRRTEEHFQGATAMFVG